MILTETKQDLFLVPNNYALVHCISADFVMGAGIAKEFTKRGVKQYLLDSYAPFWEGKGYCLYSPMGDYDVYNLITKEKCYYKPTYKTIEQALISLRDTITGVDECFKIAMPLIGCGLDRLEWGTVKEIIKTVFNDYDSEILVCRL